jgi:hypothetical protein
MLSRLRHAHDVPVPLRRRRRRLRTGEPTVTTYHSYAAALVGEHALRIGWSRAPAGRRAVAGSTPPGRRVVRRCHGRGRRAVTTVVGDVLRSAPTCPSTSGSRRRRGPDSPGPGAPQAATSHRRPGATRTCELLACSRQAGAAADGAGLHEAKRPGDGLRRPGGRGGWIAVEHPEVGEIERGRFGAVLLDGTRTPARHSGCC